MNCVATWVSQCNVPLSEIEFPTPVLACKWFVLLFTHGFTTPTFASTPEFHVAFDQICPEL